VGQSLAGQFPPQVEAAESVRVRRVSKSIVLILLLMIIEFGYFILNL
jgi:hypothetical protein